MGTQESATTDRFMAAEMLALVSSDGNLMYKLQKQLET